jgi:hypothetical protein
MVRMAVGQSDLLDVSEVEPQVQELHKSGIIVSRVYNGQIISLKKINIAGKIIAEEKKGLLEQGVADLQEFSQSLPVFLGMKLVIADFIHRNNFTPDKLRFGSKFGLSIVRL